MSRGNHNAPEVAHLRRVPLLVASRPVPTRPHRSCAVLALLCACAPATPAASRGPATPTPAPAPAAQAEPGADAPPGAVVRAPEAGERHFAALRQLTFEGENAEAYWSFDGSQLVFQATRPEHPCDQIYRIDADGGVPLLLSGNVGRTTCAFFLPGDERILYASTRAAGDGCLDPPDRSHGYVWKLYPEYDIYTARAEDGGDLRPLIVGPGYDAEATVSPAGDRIVFTSTRDGDPEIYSVRIDGTGLTRLTNTPGYDGGPFFSPDGTKIVYRANHPQGADEMAKYREIVAEHLVRPTRLELFVMDADGSNQRQITHNGAANFAPSFHPSGEKIIFASNVHDPKGRNFDLYLVDLSGENLERVTFHPSFDGFPMFSPDGTKLAFASNRHGAAPGDTNVFVADWRD